MGAPVTKSAAWQGRFAAVRDEAIDSSVALLAALSLPALALLALRAALVGWQPGMAVSIGLTAVLCGTYLARGRLPAAAKAAVTLGVLFAAALDAFLAFGLASYGALYLAAAVVLATLLLGPRWGLRALGAAVALACALALAVAAHRLSVAFDLDADNATPVAWLGLPVTLVFAAGTLLAAGGKLYAALVEELRASVEWAEALRESEARQAAILDAIPDLIFRISRAGEYLDMRASQDRLLFVPPEAIIGHTVGELMPSEVAQASVRAIAQTLETGTPQVVEYQLPLPDGQRYFEARLMVSGPDEVLSMVRDITERKRAEEAIGRLVALVDTTSDAIIGLGVDRTITSWNGGAERLYGYLAAEAVGRSIDLLVVPGGPNEAALIGAALRRGESVVDLDTVRQRKDGSVVPVSMSVSHVRDGSGAIIGAVGTHRDISGRKAAEEALARANAELARANAELETILRVLPIGIGVADDPAVSRIRMNPAFARMHSLPLGANASLTAPKGERPSNFRVYQGGRELAVEELPFNVTAATGREVRDLEYEVVREDGARVTQLVNTAPLFDEAGRVRGAVGAHLDITALRELERAREEFLVAAAHDLRTPLTAIRGKVQIVQRELERLGTPEVAPLVALLLRAMARADGMLALIRELGDVARLRLGGALGLAPRPTDLVALVHGAVEAERAVSGRTIQVEAGPGELRAEVDPARVERVLGNLLANAVKYSPPETAIRVRLGREEGPNGPEAVLCVRDAGVGIPAADLPHIFDLFRRGSNVAGLAEGTGVGLASARSVVEQHGGRIAVESAEGAGTAFTVRLPLRPPALQSTPSSSPGCDPPGDRRR